MAKETKIRRVKAKESPKKIEKVEKPKAEKQPKISKYRAKVEGVQLNKKKKELPKWLRIILLPFKIVGVILAFILKPFAKIFSPIGKYFAESWSELKLVRWPTRRETWKLTGAVIIFSVAFAVLILGYDAFFNWIFTSVIKK